MLVELLVKFLSPQCEPINKTFEDSVSLTDVVNAIISHLEANKWPKYTLQEVEMVTNYPKRTLAHKDFEVKLSTISEGQKRLQIMVKIVKSLLQLDENGKSDKIPQNIICPISRNILLYPWVTKCGHVYERTAIEIWISKNAICPVCEKRIYREDLKEAPLEFREKINELIQGCSEISSYDKVVYDQKIKNMKKNKMYLLKIKKQVRRIEKPGVQSNPSAWKKEHSPIVFYEDLFDSKIKCIPSWISFEIENFKAKDGTRLFGIEGNLIASIDNLIFDFENMYVISAVTGEPKKMTHWNSKDKKLSKYQFQNQNSSGFFQEYENCVIQAAIDSKMSCIYISEHEYNASKMILIHGDERFQIKKVFDGNIQVGPKKPSWQYFSDGIWIEYPRDVQKLIETVYAIKAKDVMITRESKCKIIFKEMTETRLDNGDQTRIQRILQ